MTKQKPYLHETLAFYDAVQLLVLAAEAPQGRSAILMKIYTARHGMSGYTPGQQISFVYGPTTWGNNPLVTGQKAIVFLNASDKAIREKPFHGHYVIEDIAGEPHAIVPHLKTEGSTDEIIAQSRPAPYSVNARAIRLASLEQHIANVSATLT